MKTIYGLVPLLTPDPFRDKDVGGNYRMGEFIPARIDLDEDVTSNISVAASPEGLRLSLPQQEEDRSREHLIGLSGVVLFPPEGFASIPPIYARVRANYGLFNKRKGGTMLGIHHNSPDDEAPGEMRRLKGKDFGIAEIVAEGYDDGERAYVVARNSVMRRAEKEDVIFTPEFLKAAFNKEAFNVKDVIDPSHAFDLARSYGVLVNSGESGWISEETKSAWNENPAFKQAEMAIRFGGEMSIGGPHGKEYR